MPAIGVVCRMSRPGHFRRNAAMEFERRAGGAQAGDHPNRLQGLTNPSVRGRLVDDARLIKRPGALLL